MSRRLTGWIVLLLLLAAWEGAPAAGLVSPRLLPPVYAVLLAGWRLLRSGELARDVAVSSGRALRASRLAARWRWRWGRPRASAGSRRIWSTP